MVSVDDEEDEDEWDESGGGGGADEFVPSRMKLRIGSFSELDGTLTALSTAGGIPLFVG